MKGHIRERGKGNWYAVLDAIDPETGERKRKWHKLEAKGKREAQDECATLISQKKSGTYAPPSKTTLKEFLEKRWLPHIKPNVELRTYERYEDLALKNIAPLLGSLKLTGITAQAISLAYVKALESGRRDGKGGLSARTVHHMHRTLSKALKQAVKWRLLVRNPCDDLDKNDRPKIVKKPVAAIDATLTVQVLEAARERRLFVPLLLGSLTGLRRGEIAALRWTDIKFDQGHIAVIRSVAQAKDSCYEKLTKSDRCRTVAMPDMLVEELKDWKLRQAEEFLRLGIRPDNDTHVVTQPDGSGYQPRSLTHAISDFLKAQGQSVRLHGMRHSHASHMLAENVHPKIVQERLGHSSIAITMDIYSHLMPNMQADAAAKVDAALKAAKKPR
jgi:integrase